VNNQPFYLNPLTRTLQEKPLSQAATVQYVANDNPGRVSFLTTFDAPVTMVGYPKAKLFMEVDGYDDMDIFIIGTKIRQIQ
jgi:predicted acyl esterase